MNALRRRGRARLPPGSDLRESCRVGVRRVVELDHFVISITDLRIANARVPTLRGYDTSAAIRTENADEADHANDARLFGLPDGRRVSGRAKAFGPRWLAGFVILDASRVHLALTLVTHFPLRLASLASILDLRVGRTNCWPGTGSHRVLAQFFEQRPGIWLLPIHGAGDRGCRAAERSFLRGKASAQADRLTSGEWQRRVIFARPPFLTVRPLILQSVLDKEYRESKFVKSAAQVVDVTPRNESAGDE